MKMFVETDFPVAYESKDHTVPKGTIQDNTHNMRFVWTTEGIFKRKVVHADLGCAGGGLVKDFVDRGHTSIGIEGSDTSKKMKRAEWATIPDNLFTADITKPFRIVDENGQQVLCDLITSWEVMEHIAKDQLDSMMTNIRNHLKDGGMFVCSVATFEDEGYHVTLEPKEWWVEQFAKHGLVEKPGSGYSLGDMVRHSSFYLYLMKV